MESPKHTLAIPSTFNKPKRVSFDGNDVPNQALEKDIIMGEFFGFGGYQRAVEGYLSWQHLLFVSSLMFLMVSSAVFFGLRDKKKEGSGGNTPLKVASICMVVLELFKIVLLCFRNNSPMNWLYNLPLFLCSIQLITMPIAAFAKGRVKEVASDFLATFGLVGAILGTYFAGNNYSAYPVLSFDNVVSGLTHSLAGFGSLYVMIVSNAKLEWRNLPFSLAIITAFCAVALLADKLLPYNYMFLIRGDGTPYDLAYSMVDGHSVLYPLIVIFLFYLFIGVFYAAFHGFKALGRKLKNKPISAKAS